MKRKKGFTLVELLVVIAIIALLMGILMPALARVRRLAHRLICGTNLSGIGKSMQMYAHDNQDLYPRSGREHNTEWSGDVQINDWQGQTRSQAYSADETTITADFYLLVKYADASPGLFVCNGDDAVEFSLSEAGEDLEENIIRDIIDPWDFGQRFSHNDRHPGSYVSYSYHLGHGWSNERPRPATSTHSGQFAVAADRNITLDQNAREYVNPNGTVNTDTDFQAPTWDDGELSDPDGIWNSAAHTREGQNVLYADTHVEFQRDPLAGVNGDNIWRGWEAGRQPPQSPEDRAMQGHWASSLGAGVGPGYRDDSFLVNTPQP